MQDAPSMLPIISIESEGGHSQSDRAPARFARTQANHRMDWDYVHTAYWLASPAILRPWGKQLSCMVLACSEWIWFAASAKSSIWHISLN